MAGGLADRYPLSAYALDYHVDVGVTDPEGVPPMIAQWAAAQLWSATSFLVGARSTSSPGRSRSTCSAAPRRAGADRDAITNLYENVIGRPGWSPRS